MFVLQVCHSIIRMNHTKNYKCESLYNFIALEINILYRNVSILYIQYILIYCTGQYVHEWCSHTLYRMRLSVP